MDRAQLKESFSAVPIGLKLLDGPLQPGSPSIFQMSIHRSPRFGEYFQIWPGARDNEVEVLSADPSFLQLVLRIKEPRRRYVEVVPKWWRASLEAVEAHARSGGGRILKETRYDWRVEMWTPSVDRRYLCGRDDLHLFIAQVRDGDTVAQAHDSLKPDEVRRVEGLTPGVQRQGEWFFLPPSGEESERLDQDLRGRNRATRNAAPVGEGANPHVADLVVQVDRRTRSQHREYRRLETYARGSVLHADHRPLWLDGWRKVVRNREIAGDTPQTRRVRWID